MSILTIRSILLSLTLLGATSVNAVTYSFEQLLGNSNANVGQSGSDQLKVDITAFNSSTIFTFTNAVGTPSSITAVYFDDVDNANIFSNISNNILGGGSGESIGVNFSDGANPANIPQGNTIGFLADFSGDSANPSITNGVNASGEFVSFFGLTRIAPNSFDAVIAAINSRDFRIGLSVQSIGGGGADRYELAVGGAPSEVPLPAAAWLFGSALLGFAGFKRKNI